MQTLIMAIMVDLDILGIDLDMEVTGLMVMDTMVITTGGLIFTNPGQTEESVIYVISHLQSERNLRKKTF